MLRAWSIAIRNRRFRIPLLLVGVLATVAFGPVSAFGVYVLIIGMLSNERDLLHVLGWGIAGVAGVIGIAGTWVRLLVPGPQFQTHPPLKWATAAALAAGMLAAAFVFTGVLRNHTDLMAWLTLPVFAAGVFLLGATIGEKRSNSTIERDGPQATRPSS
jgi:hypothetical protein